MFFDRVSFSTATTGTGTITAGAATSGFRTIASASIPDGTTVDYAIEDGAAWETGTGVVGGTSTTLTRVRSASSTGALLNLSGTAKCFITPIATSVNGIPYASGRWYSSLNGRLSVNSNLSTNNTVLYPMEYLRADVTITDLACRIMAASAGQNIQLGIYASDPVTGEPTGTPVATTGSMSCAATGTVSSALSAPVTLLKGKLYYIGGMATSSGPSFQFVAPESTTFSTIQGAGDLTELMTSTPAYAVPWRYTHTTFGTWLDLTGVSAARTTGPGVAVFFKTA